MAAVFTALGTMAAIIGAGWFLGYRGTLGAGGLPVLARVCFAVATPCLLFVTVAHANLHLLLSRSALIAGVSTTVVALCTIFMLALVWRREAADVVVGTLAASYVNAGNLGLPLAVYLLGDAVAVVPPLLFQLLVIAPIAFSVLDARLTTARSGVRGIVTRTFDNPIIVASLSGLLLAALPMEGAGGAAGALCADRCRGRAARSADVRYVDRGTARPGRSHPAARARPGRGAAVCGQPHGRPPARARSWPGRHHPAGRRRDGSTADRPERARLRDPVRAWSGAGARCRSADHDAGCPGPAGHRRDAGLRPTSG